MWTFSCSWWTAAALEVRRLSDLLVLRNYCSPRPIIHLRSHFPWSLEHPLPPVRLSCTWLSRGYSGLQSFSAYQHTALSSLFFSSLRRLEPCVRWLLIPMEATSALSAAGRICTSTPNRQKIPRSLNASPAGTAMTPSIIHRRPNARPPRLVVMQMTVRMTAI